MRKITVLLAMFAMFSAGSGIAQQPSPAKVDGGLLQGTFEDGLTVYRGIPFAAPPVDNLRWRAPQPPSKWDGIKQANKFAPGPIQGGNPPSGKSEDCLYLNIWTPAKSAGDHIPVLVWIYGGGFGAGATSEKNYSGENLAKKGVVLVSIAYRVGQLGFLAHPELSKENPDHVSGNYGLLDLIAGLQWVKKNIAAFGGDPNKVTIFGESAGGIAVSMLCASPLAKGLFHGAISQSGGSFGPPRPTTFPGENLKRLANAEVDGQAYLKSAGVSSIAELRKIDTDKLPAGRGLGMSWPIIDGFVIPDDQYKLYDAGHFNDTPILVGYNSDEGASFSPPRTPQAYIAGVQMRYGPFAENLLKAYPTDSGTVPKTARDLARDAAFGWHTWIWARLQSKMGKSKAFYYYFDQHPDYPEGSSRAGYGSPHGQDVAYVFQHLDASNPQTTKTDLDISEAMATYWTNFAKHGDPSGKGVPVWPSFSDANPVVMYFSQTPHTGPVPSAGSLKSLDAYFAWRRTPEGEQVTVQTQTKEKKQIIGGEQAPPANPGQNNFGGPRPAVGAGGQRPAIRQPRPEPKIQTVSLDDISMSDPYIYPDEKSQTYYLTGTGGRLFKSKDLKMWTGPYPIIELTGTWMDGLFVAAAEIHNIGNKYYYAGTWSDHSTLIEAVPRRYNVPRNQTQLLVADSPDGPFKPLVAGHEFCLGPEDWDIIDGTLYEENDTTYLVFVHEWTQLIDGTMAYMPLSKDLTHRTAEPTTIFRASEAAWSKEMNTISEATFGLKMPGWVTDGPQMFRTKTGKLGMLWSSWGVHRYAQGIAYSSSGSIRGPWVQEPEALKGDNSGHGMIFTTVDGKRLFIIHHSEGNGPRKPEMYEIDDSGDKLILGKRYNP